MSNKSKQEKQEKIQIVNKKIIYEDKDTSWRTRGRTTREIELEAQDKCFCILL